MFLEVVKIWFPAQLVEVNKSLNGTPKSIQRIEGIAVNYRATSRIMWLVVKCGGNNAFMLSIGCS